MFLGQIILDHWTGASLCNAKNIIKDICKRVKLKKKVLVIKVFSGTLFNQQFFFKRVPLFFAVLVLEL